VTTIHDIAKKLGKHPSSVSRALRGGAGVGPELREQILATAAAMGYRPNLMARHLRTRSSPVIGLVLDHQWNWYSAATADGVQEGARRRGLNVMVWNAASREDEAKAVEYFAQLPVAGVIVASSRLDPAAALPEAQLPLVAINRMGGPGVRSILTDDYQGAAAAVAHLVDLGHRQIGYISGPVDWPHSIDRLRGTVDALAKAGLGLPPDLYGQGDWSRESGRRETRRFLGSRLRPTAIFAANDEMAAGVYDEARRLGRSIPGNLSVIGFNDHVACEYLDPPLTTVTLPLREMGLLAVESLFQKEPPPPPVAGRLIIRHSTAPLP